MRSLNSTQKWKKDTLRKQGEYQRYTFLYFAVFFQGLLCFPFMIYEYGRSWALTWFHVIIFLLSGKDYISTADIAAKLCLEWKYSRTFSSYLGDYLSLNSIVHNTCVKKFTIFNHLQICMCETTGEGHKHTEWYFSCPFLPWSKWKKFISQSLPLRQLLQLNASTITYTVSIEDLACVINGARQEILFSKSNDFVPALHGIFGVNEAFLFIRKRTYHVKQNALKTKTYLGGMDREKLSREVFSFSFFLFFF